MRGMYIAPHCLPAHPWATRIQQELFSSRLPSLSQKNCTITRPYLSGQISSPDLPTTTAVWVPCIRGFRAMRGGRNGTLLGIASNEFEYSNASIGPEL